MGRVFRVALMQLEPLPGAPGRNAEKLLEYMERVEADLYIYPELFLTGYTSKDLLYRYSLTLEDEPVRRVAEAAAGRGSWVVAGFPERDGRGIIYNSALIAGPGLTDTYRKRHLPTFSVFDEHRWFRPWRGRLRVWDIGGLRLGVAICYDAFYPEIYRAYALLGADLIVTISASPDTSVPLFDTVLRSRALENTVYIAWVNLPGVYGGLGFGGSSMLIEPSGRIVKRLKPFTEDYAVVEVDTGVLERFRRVRPVLRDSYLEDAVELLRAYMVFEGVA